VAWEADVNGTVLSYYYGIDKSAGIFREGFGEMLMNLQGFVCVRSRCCTVGQSVAVARFSISEMIEWMMKLLVILRLVGTSVVLRLKEKFVI
jgi:hypothetical protein